MLPWGSSAVGVEVDLERFSSEISMMRSSKRIASARACSLESWGRRSSRFSTVRLPCELWSWR